MPTRLTELNPSMAPTEYQSSSERATPREFTRAQKCDAFKKQYNPIKTWLTPCTKHNIRLKRNIIYNPVAVNHLLRYYTADVVTYKVEESIPYFKRSSTSSCDFTRSYRT